ncbi:hypothetical protein MIJ3_00274 [Pseudomonas phage vB_PaeM_MIJ3]|nr:hypothetical protein Deiofobo_0243 [Pseudomonas phage Deifobo]WPK39953.1 hypothetical protein ETTORE_0244 [Pseudomonas phage Ettore]WPK40473.1 hypothetical protein Paride_0243 [Pseudomonas phage Paride]VOH55277.1 hypothetical protein MIJ3_00274 [Pseudomonas phage vB_PaeM_MIJ3]
MDNIFYISYEIASCRYSSPTTFQLINKHNREFYAIRLAAGYPSDIFDFDWKQKILLTSKYCNKLLFLISREKIQVTTKLRIFYCLSNVSAKSDQVTL